MQRQTKRRSIPKYSIVHNHGERVALTLRVTPEINESLKYLAYHQGISVNEYILDALKKFMK